MPHSPRWYEDRLWLLESGDGSIARATSRRGRGRRSAGCRASRADSISPGRSPSSDCRKCEIGDLQRPAAHRTIAGTHCGVYVVDLRNGQTVAFLQFQAGVQEIFAVQVLHGIRYPDVLPEDEDKIANSFVLPD